jgi:hypothetical protein
MPRISCNPYTMMVKYDLVTVNGAPTLTNLWGFEV